jgi:hypothetical protein
MKKIYIAGKLNDDAVGYIKNMHKMIKTAKAAREAGFSVYVPCVDILEGLVDGNFTYKDFFDNSQPWLLASDGVLLTPGWETSEGTKREIKLAEDNNIPVFLSVEGMVHYFHVNQHHVPRSYYGIVSTKTDLLGVKYSSVPSKFSSCYKLVDVQELLNSELTKNLKQKFADAGKRAAVRSKNVSTDIT